MVEMVQTSWRTIFTIFQDSMIFLSIELAILKVVNPVFFEKIEETINEWSVFDEP
jgi:hypothetical protein